MFGIVQCIHDVWFELQCHLVGTISVGFSPVFGNNLGHPFSRDSFGSLFRNVQFPQTVVLSNFKHVTVDLFSTHLSLFAFSGSGNRGSND